MYVCGFRFYFTPLPGFFSPFLHSTGSLSVDHEYLALEDGPPIFRQDVTCPALLYGAITLYSRPFQTLLLSFVLSEHWAAAISLAATFAISVDFFSWSYLDVSVRSVRLTHLCIQCVIPTYVGGFPHSEICGSMPVCRLPAAYRKLLRPSSPVIAKASTTYT